MFHDRDEAGLGVVVRDAQGLSMASLAHKIKLPWSVEVVEALAAKRAVQFALEISITKGELEGDLVTIVRALKVEGASHAMFGLIIDDIRALSSNLEKVQFSHIKCRGNCIAHALARHAQHCDASKSDKCMCAESHIEHILGQTRLY